MKYEICFGKIAFRFDSYLAIPFVLFLFLPLLFLLALLFPFIFLIFFSLFLFIFLPLLFFLGLLGPLVPLSFFLFRFSFLSADLTFLKRFDSGFLRADECWLVPSSKSLLSLAIFPKKDKALIIGVDECL